MKKDPELDYAESRYSPNVWRIGGVRLSDFRTGHKLVLQAVQSPFFCRKDFKPADLIFALWVCSRSYADVKRGRISIVWRLWAAWLTWRFKRDQVLFYSRINLFFEYLEAHFARPSGVRKVKRDGDAEAEVTCAPSLMVLKRDLGLPETEFWELPMRAAIFDRYGVIEEDGVVTWPAAWERGSMSGRPDNGGPAPDQKEAA